MNSVRDPYSFPRLENDENFRGAVTTLKEPYGLPTHLAQKQDPWSRLNARATLSSGRREAFHPGDPDVPNDSLDFILKGHYNQHKEFLKDKPETLMQSETLLKPHSRILKNKTFQVPPPKEDLNHPLRITESKKKQVPHSIKTAIEGHHAQTTNGGYSRKPNGGFFTA